MNDIPLVLFKDAIHATHGVQANLVSREQVLETDGEAVWEQEVLVFALHGHPAVLLCYAWEVDGKFTAILHQGPVDSPLAAIRAAILAAEPELPEGT